MKSLLPVVLVALAGLLTACSSSGNGSAFPDDPPPAAVGMDFTIEPMTALPISRTRLLVALAATATRADVEAARAAAGSGARVAGGWAVPHVVMLVISDSPDLAAIYAAMDAVARLPRVDGVAPDVALSPASLPDAPLATAALTGAEAAAPNLCPPRPATPLAWSWVPAAMGGGLDSNWGFQWAGFPGAWSWNDHIGAQTQVVAGVVDGLVDVSHPDLTGMVSVDPSADQNAAGPPDDHGSHVAGTIAANFHNKLMGSGATPFVRVVNQPLPQLAAPPGADLGTVFQSAGDMLLVAVRRSATNAGVRVINLSQCYNWVQNWRRKYEDNACLISTLPPRPESVPRLAEILKGQGYVALAAARTMADSGVFLTAAAGNDGVTADRVDANGAQNQPLWELPASQYGSPFCYAARLGAPNVFCVEALEKTSDRTSVVRTGFSGVGGTISAPGELVGSTSACNKGTSCLNADGYKHLSGTSQAAPFVAGLIAHMLAYKADLTVADVRAAIVTNARAATDPSTAPGLDAFKTMLSLPGAVRDLFDVDDGSEDGDDLTVGEDTHGDGKVDMRDFRRLRDGFLWTQGDRDFLSKTGAGATKLDLNEDGVLNDSAPEYFPRTDFDGDGALSPGDFQAMAQLPTSIWTDPDAPASAVTSLRLSGDLHVDGGQLFDMGATSINVTADGAPYSVTLTKDHPAKILSVPTSAATTTATVHGTVTGGPSGLAVKDMNVAVGWGQRVPVTLQPGAGGGTTESAGSIVFTKVNDVTGEIEVFGFYTCAAPEKFNVLYLVTNEGTSTTLSWDEYAAGAPALETARDNDFTWTAYDKTTADTYYNPSSLVNKWFNLSGQLGYFANYSDTHLPSDEQKLIDAAQMAFAATPATVVAE